MARLNMPNTLSRTYLNLCFVAFAFGVRSERSFLINWNDVNLDTYYQSLLSHVEHAWSK